MSLVDVETGEIATAITPDDAHADSPAARARAERAGQGLPMTIQDTDTLNRVARIVQISPASFTPVGGVETEPAPSPPPVGAGSTQPGEAA